MKRRLLINRILSLLVCSVMCVSCMVPVAAAPAKAEKNAEIQLAEAEGDVTVVNGSGREIPYVSDMAPDNGDHVKTQESSYLWLDLGDGCAAKMDAHSGVEFRTLGSKKEILLDEGSLYFNFPKGDLNIRTMTAALNVQNACGWIRVTDREHTLICILSGEGVCSVTDPVSRQVKSEPLNGSDLAECVVYPQDHEGDKCDILLRKFEEDDVAGFVLTELAENPPLLEQIAEASGADLSLQAEDAQNRLREEESALQQKLDELNGKLEKQENNIAKDPTWEGDAEEKEENVAAVEEEWEELIPFPVPKTEPPFGGEILEPFPSAAPAVPSPEPESGSDNEPEPGQGENTAAPSEPAANPGSASMGPDNSLKVGGISTNEGEIRVGKDGQAVFANAFTNTSSYCWIENEGQITFEGNLNNEEWAYITNKAQLTAKGDISNCDRACIKNGGQITAEKNVYNGAGENRRSGTISTRESGSQFDVAGKFINDYAYLYLSGGTISEFEQRNEDVEIYDAVISSYIQTGGNVKIYDATISNYTQTGGASVLFDGKIEEYTLKENADSLMLGGTISKVIQTGGFVYIGEDGIMEESLSYDDAGTTNDIPRSVIVENGYKITGGSLDMSAGTLEAGTSDAALTVNISGSGVDGDSDDGSGSGGVSISGGTIFGNGSGKAAISAISGGIMIGSAPEVNSLDDEDADSSSDVFVYAENGESPYGPVAVKAYNIFDTIRSDGDEWRAFMYPDNHLYEQGQYEAGCDSLVYVGREEDGLVYLGYISSSFPDAAKDADYGDIITLKDDVDYEGFSGTIGGSQATIDLNGKRLEADIDFENASWVINGKGTISGKFSNNRGILTFNEVTINGNIDNGRAEMQNSESDDSEDDSSNYGATLNINQCNMDGNIYSIRGNVKITNSALNGAVVNGNGALTINNSELNQESSVWIGVADGSLNINGGKYKYNESYAKDGSIISIIGGNILIEGGAEIIGNEYCENKDEIVPIRVLFDIASAVTIGNAVIDGVGYPALIGYYSKEVGGITLSIGDRASISSKSEEGTIGLRWEEGKCSLNLNGGEIVNEFHDFSENDAGGKDERTAPAVCLDKSDKIIPSCLSEIHTELKSEPREDLGGIADAVWIGLGGYRTVWDGNCWRLELIDYPVAAEAAESTIMAEEANLLEDAEITEPETDETLETENPDEPKDPEDEENPDETREPSESEDPSESKDPAESEEPKEPAEGGGDEGGSSGKETLPGGDDVLPPENAEDKKEEEPVNDEGASKEGESAEEQSE